ncbi:MAG: DUF3747 domain-containing protein [Xenococcaceae cyanobacterium]
MKLSRSLKIATIVTAAFASVIPFMPTKAVVTSEENIPQNQVTAVAAPYGNNNYNLVVIEQIPDKDNCWNETGTQPTIIDPVWTTFDFTGHCRRATDSNGYSVRLDGQDTSQDYLLSLVEKDRELQLVALNRQDRSRTVIGHTFGLSDGEFLKIYLSPGWQFTKKTVDDKVLGHVYFSGDTQAIAAAGDTPPTPPPAPSFPDVANDIYRDEIGQAVALGFIAGFNDNTFRPEEPLTREQLVSMVIGALDSVPGIEIQPSTQVTVQPYSDVDSSRWSAAKIEWAKQNQIVSGYPDGTFRPDQAVSRAELMAVLRQAAQFVNTEQGMSPDLKPTAQVNQFADISGHWGEDLIQQMSTYCRVASPLNESGNAFSPNTPAGRNYAAAATLRMHSCISGQVSQNQF